MLQLVQGYNEVSPQLRKMLDDEISKQPRYVKYKFYIAKKNPDGQHKPGEEYLYPGVYTLTPVTYSVIDTGDKRSKKIGLYATTELHGEIEEKVWRRIVLKERDMGILTLDLQQTEHREDFEYLEMHPKNENGFFRDKNIPAMFCRVDELKEAKTRTRQKEMRAQALMVAAKLSEQEVRTFAAAMNWSELEDFDIIKDKMLEMADKDPDFFKKMLDDPNMVYKALIRRCLDANVITWLPTENKFAWANGTTICLIDMKNNNNYLETMADWLTTSKNGPEIASKLGSMLKAK